MGEGNQHRREDGDEPEICRRHNTARWDQGILGRTCRKKVKKKVKVVLYSAVSSPLDCSKCFTLFAFPDRPVHSDTVLGFSGKHSKKSQASQ